MKDGAWLEKVIYEMNDNGGYDERKENAMKRNTTL